MSTPHDEIKDAIVENIQTPQSVSVDGQSVSAKSLKDQIEAAKYIAGQEAVASAPFGLRIARIVPPGAV
jgi:hypothetical protein